LRASALRAVEVLTPYFIGSYRMRMGMGPGVSRSDAVSLDLAFISRLQGTMPNRLKPGLHTQALHMSTLVVEVCAHWFLVGVTDQAFC
jgi:hypothetical protein